MPNIKIREQEAVSLAAFDITENTVLVPMLYARSYETSTDENTNATEVIYTDTEAVSRLFTSANAFRGWASGHTVTVDSGLDKSYIMAYELLLQGLNVVIKPLLYENATVGTDLSEDEAYNLVEGCINNGDLDEFKNRNLFNIKFITTGGYANCGKTYEVTEDDEVISKTTTSYTAIRELAEARGDAIALIEFKDFVENETELFDMIQEQYTPDGAGDLYSAAFFPWFNFTTTANNTQSTVLMPSSFGYLMAYAESVKSNANWFAAAGTVRGYIPGLVKPSFDVGEALMHTLQGDEEAGQQLNIMINPIYNAGTYGYRIWGNRVVNKTSSVLADRYMNFLNVRMLLCDIKKQIYHTAMRCTFEPNDDIVWINFKTLANSLLDRMKSGRGISWYKWTKEVADKKATIKATLTIQPIEAVESFDINIILTDEEVTIEDATV